MLTSNLTAEYSLSVFMSFKCCWLGSICDRRLNLKSNSLKAEDYRPTWGQGVLESDYLRSLLIRAPWSALSLEAVEGVTVRAVVTSWRHDSIRPKKKKKVDLFKFERSCRLLFINKNEKIVHAKQLSNFRCVNPCIVSQWAHICDCCSVFLCN